MSFSFQNGAVVVCIIFLLIGLLLILMGIGFIKRIIIDKPPISIRIPEVKGTKQRVSVCLFGSILMILGCLFGLTPLPLFLPSPPTNPLPGTPTPLPTQLSTPTSALPNTPGPTSPKIFMEGYCNAAKDGRAKDIYEMETPEYQKIETLERIENEIIARPIEKCELGQPPSDNSNPVVLYSITFFPSRSQPHKYTETLKFDNGAWKIDGEKTEY